VKAIVPKGKAARVTFEKGAIIRKPEIGTLVLDEKLLPQVVTKALETGADEVQIPLLEGEKKVSDEQLAQIKEVVSEYSTHFPAYQTSRNTNIRLASAKLNGTVLMPGEKISFNQTVGQRTVQDGYRTAPVLVNGRHDTGIGGGICQVSTTLYNASLLSDLKIVKRQNHSIPSVYVPVGRDATVDWPNLDLVIQNNQKVPIAISSTYQSGKITFRILGQAHPERKVKILTENHQIWDRGEQTVVDRTLPPGARRVTEKGSRAHAIDVYRIVYENGVEVRRDKLSHSVYGGSPRIIGYNPAAPAPKPSAPVPGTPNALPAQDGQSNG
jgi:vancomycin resistance protein YoaR